MTIQGSVHFGDTSNDQGAWIRTEDLRSATGTDRKLRNDDRVRSHVDDGFVSLRQEGKARSIDTPITKGIPVWVRVEWYNDTSSRVTLDTLEVWVFARELGRE